MYPLTIYCSYKMKSCTMKTNDNYIQQNESQKHNEREKIKSQETTLQSDTIFIELKKEQLKNVPLGLHTYFRPFYM